jgi:lysophospholipase L1-like esterase
MKINIRHKVRKKNIFIIFLFIISVLSVGVYKDKQVMANKLAKINQWHEAKANFIGDSITYGLDPLDHNKSMTYRYTDSVKEKCEFLELNNYGVVGSTIAKISANNNSFIERYNAMNNNADLIGIFGGTNDYGLDVPLGAINDGDNTHFKNAFNSLIKGIVTKYPNKKIFVITPIPRNTKYPYNNSLGLTLKDYVDAEIEICKSYKVPVLNLYESYGIDPFNENDKKSYMPDGLHPNEDGQKILADKVIDFINNL